MDWICRSLREKETQKFRFDVEIYRYGRQEKNKTVKKDFMERSQ